MQTKLARDRVARRSGCCRATMAVHALTFLMTINSRTIRDCATTISDNTFARRRERIVGRASETESVAWAPHAFTYARGHACTYVRARTLERGSVHATCVRCLRLPTPRRSRVPTALCVCRAWDRHCLLLLVLLSPGHGRSRWLAWPIEILLPSNSIILNMHAPSNVSQTSRCILDLRQSRGKKGTCYKHSQRIPLAFISLITAIC